MKLVDDETKLKEKSGSDAAELTVIVEDEPNSGDTLKEAVPAGSQDAAAKPNSSEKTTQSQKQSSKGSSASAGSAIQTPPRPVKDNWDKLAAVSPIISGALIFMIGGVFTYAYNEQQLRLQEIQTIERFIPHLMGSEQSKKASILAISSLTNAEMAGKFAAIFASSGTVSALETMARSGNSREKKVAQKAIPDAIEVMSAKDGKLSDVEQKLRTSLASAPVVPDPSQDNSDYMFNLARLGQTYTLEGQYDLAKPLLQKSLDLRIKTFGANHPQVADAYRSLAELARLSGDTKQAQNYLNQAKAIEKSGSTTTPEPVQTQTGAPQDQGGATSGDSESKSPDASTTNTGSQNMSTSHSASQSTSTGQNTSASQSNGSNSSQAGGGGA